MNPSGRSCQKSDREQIAQVAHDKSATVSNLLRSLMIKEWIRELLCLFWANRSFAVSLTKTEKRAIRSKNLIKIVFFGTFFVGFKKKSDSLILSF